MRLLLTLPLLILAACGEADQPEQRTVESPCEPLYFEQTRFTVCSEPGGTVEIATADADGQPYRSFVALEQALGERAANVAFGMNAGMYDDNGNAIGLLVEDGEKLHKLNRNEGGGNFGLLPNGVFSVSEQGRAAVTQTEDFEPEDVRFATQSGPMLVIDGKLHPKFDPDGESRHIRNGVGIAPDGTPLFAISEEPVSFGKFARLFRDQLKAKNALYFDGSVSSLWDPAAGRRDAGAPLGPMVVVFKSARPAPDRQTRRR